MFASALLLATSVDAALYGNTKYDAFSISAASLKETPSVIAPKAVVVNTFKPEAAVWQKHINFTHNITLPGLSPLYPNVTCTEKYDLCHIVTGEGEINAASSISAFLTSSKFDLAETYFLVNGIAGLNPSFGGLGSAAFARFTVSVALQYEIDAREMPKNWTTGYWAYGTDEPGEAPENYYGTEVFEVNEKLRDFAAGLAAANNSLANSKAAKVTDMLYQIPAARRGAQVLKCDSATSDVYYTGEDLASEFGNTSKLFTNGSAQYCTTAQEDSAILEAAVRAAKFNLTDFDRWVLLRTASDFDRPPVNMRNNSVGFFNHNNTGGFNIAIENLYNAGYPFIKAVLRGWDNTTTVVNGTAANVTFANGTVLNVTFANATNVTNSTNGTFVPNNYVGDVFGTLGDKPDFGPGSYKEFAYI